MTTKPKTGFLPGLKNRNLCLTIIGFLSQADLGLCVARLSQAGLEQAFSGTVWQDLKVEVAKGNMLKNAKALVQFVAKRLKDKAAVRCIDLSRMVEKLGPADYKAIKEQCLPVMASMISSMIYPRQFMLPFTGIQWTKLGHITLPMLEDGAPT